MIDFITFCDYTGTFAFAISGIRLASAKQFDWFGAYVVGVVTAVGGGTIRDILLNATPFWMEQALGRCSLAADKWCVASRRVPPW